MITLDPLLPCSSICMEFYQRYWLPLDSDFHYEKYPPAILFLDEFTDVSDYIAKISYNKRYGYRKCLKLGYFVEQFNWQSFIGDIVAINTSKEIRAGGKMKPSYLETVEEKGGYEIEWKTAPKIVCFKHFSADFGVFHEDLGHKQGEIEVDKRLLAYITVIVLGEYAMYSMIIGHGNCLKDEIMTLLHIKVFEFLKESTPVKYLEYHTFISGEKTPKGKYGLTDWKQYFLFRPEPCKWKYSRDHKF